MGELWERQVRHCLNKAKLIIWTFDQGFEMTSGASLDPPMVCPECKKKGIETEVRRHIKNSFHNNALADDFNLFRNGLYLRRTEDHKPIGDKWESLDPLCSWGGRWGDGNHYSTGEVKK